MNIKFLKCFEILNTKNLQISLAKKHESNLSKSYGLIDKIMVCSNDCQGVCSELKINNQC